LKLDAEKLERLAKHAQRHLEQLAEGIGPRGSCRPAEREAAQYVASTFHSLGLAEIHQQPFRGSPTSYGRYAVAFATAILSQILAGVLKINWAYVLAGFVHAASAWAIFAESDFRQNWTHRIIHAKPSQNVIALRRASELSQRQGVITAHIDTHRTPFFNSTPSWQIVYNLSIKFIFTVMCLGALLGILAGAMDAPGLKIALHISGIPLAVGLLAFLQADRTPFSPGAYDNGSGVACMLAIAEHLSRQPLQHTDVWFVATGCEETGAGGMLALVNEKADLWREALWLNLDQTGIGGLYLRLKEGMLKRYPVKPRALQLARKAAERSGVGLRERDSQAFSDSIIAHQKSLLALSIGASPVEPGYPTPRHQRNDLPDRVEPETMMNTMRFVDYLLTDWDEEAV
jgi:hypothetical protein